MTRKEFLSMCGVLGVGMPFLSACSTSKKGSPLPPSGKVIIIGAGAAGLSAAYLLRKKQIEVIVLEASDTYGGRIESVKGFTDFTIPVGAEWLHTREPVLANIVADPTVKLDVQTTAYDFEVDYGLDAETGQKVNLKSIGFSEKDLRFTNSSWLDFYEQYILPSIQDTIQYQKVVKTIDYTQDQVVVRTEDEAFTADRVIVTVPVPILKAGDIEFVPPLPEKKQTAIQDLRLYGGCKCFIAFKKPFYPTCVKMQDEGKGPTRVYYDATYGKNSQDHVLGLLAVDHYADPYLALEDPERIQFMLQELDELFAGQATPNYLRHVFKNWNEDPFAQGTYFPETSLKTLLAARTMAKPVADKLYFAGDLYTEGSSGYSMVHVAAESAKRVVDQLVGTPSFIR